MTSEIYEEKVKIGGWLILGGILLWYGAISTVFSILNIAPLVLRIHLTITYVGCIMKILELGSIIVLLMNFHKRKVSFVKWVFIYEAIVFTEVCYYMYFNYAFHEESQAGRVVGVVALLEILLVILYVLRSKRVKRTFIR